MRLLSAYKIHKMNDTLIGYKVVTSDLKSTGLKNTPVIQFDINDWNTNKEFGFWVARISSFATYVRSWLKYRYGVDSRTFVVALKDIIDVRKNGVKALSIKFLEEIETNHMYDMSKIMKEKKALLNV